MPSAWGGYGPLGVGEEGCVKVMSRTSLVLSLSICLLTLVAAACGGSVSPTAVPTPTPPPLSSSVLEELGLTESYTFDQLGFSIAYPTGWLTGSRGLTRLISELEEDHDKAWPYKQGFTTPRATKGYQVSFTAYPKGTLNNIGLSMRTLNHVMGFFATDYTLTVPSESKVTQMFRGEPALRVTGTLGFGRVVNCIVGHDPVFMTLICLGAPSEQALQEFMPTWEQMLASLRPI